MKVKIFSAIDYILLLCILCLITIGVFFIYSSGVDSQGVQVKNEYIKQIIWAVLGLILMVCAAVYDYRKFERYIKIVFGAYLIVLVYTRLFGRYVNGAKSWIGFGELGIQPSEFGKIIYILFLAEFFVTSEKLDERKRFLKSLLILLTPMGLILLQPDLGTASVYLPIFIFMCFAAGIPLRYIMIVIGFCSLTILFTVLPVWESQIVKHSVPILGILTNNKLRLLFTVGIGAIMFVGLLGKIFFKHNEYYYWITYVSAIIFGSLIISKFSTHVLKEYQIQRLIIFMDPYTDRRGFGWNIIQSITAIGAGGTFGAGFLHGTQSHLRFLPQQSTDFIFSIISEETGFIGGFFIFSVYFLLMFRNILIIRKTQNHFGYYAAAGILGMFFYHFLVNVGMVMGSMPITGIPLLFMSYGGSSLLTAMVSMGILMSINYRHFAFMIQD